MSFSQENDKTNVSFDFPAKRFYYKPKNYLGSRTMEKHVNLELV
jgi:hypothetical protein